MDNLEKEVLTVIRKIKVLKIRNAKVLIFIEDKKKKKTMRPCPPRMKRPRPPLMKKPLPPSPPLPNR